MKSFISFFFVGNQRNVLSSLKLNIYYCNKKESQYLTFIKAELIHVILGEVYFSIEEMVKYLDSVKRMSFVTHACANLMLLLGLRS